MTWLLQKIQKILGSLTRRKSGAQVSDSTQLGSEIASRLQQSNDASRSDDPVAVRVHGNLLDPVLPPQSIATRSTAPQSTAPLRQKNSSVLKDTVDPVADEPDTHQRLDAAPASLPGGTLEAPSFPTNVSELLSSPAPSASALNGDVLDSITVPSTEPPSSDEQLPDIHDLLPAVEPSPPIDTRDAPDSVSKLSEKASSTADDLSGANNAPLSDSLSDSLVVESAQRVSAAEQATLFSFDIIEADSAVESSSAERVTGDDESAHQNSDFDNLDSSSANGLLNESELDESRTIENEIVEQDLADSELVDSELADSELADESVDESIADAAVEVATATMTTGVAVTDVSEAAKDSQSAVVGLPIVGSLIPDSLLSDISAQAQGSQASTKNADAEIAGIEPKDTNSVETAAPSVSKETVEQLSTDVQNPWLTAVPAQKQNRTESAPQEILTKNGTVKLLFKLKEGNFHGYITPDDGSKDILFHQKYINAEIFEFIERGTPVVVNAEYREGKAYATRVELLQK